MLRQVRGHSNRKKPRVDQFWDPEMPLDWPDKTVWTLGEDDMWPMGTTLKGSARSPATTAGKTSAITVSGLKYSMRGGYTRRSVGPGIQPSCAQALVDAANHSLSTSTWKSYSSIWKQIGRIGQETGVTFRLPMTTDMVRGLVGALIRKGRKAGTILAYMSSLKKAHQVEGLKSDALEDGVVKAALKGLTNKESLTQTVRPVMTLALLARIRTNLREMGIAGHRKQAIWVVANFLFMGSLRGSEILAPEKTKYDPLKTFLARDIKLVQVKTGDETVTTLQLTLKAPKTSRSMPTQVVELPEVGGWLCPVKAYKSWQAGRKGRQTGDKPLFIWRDGSLITMTEINAVLGLLLEGEDPAITTRAFRPALPTILAKQGATEESLKALGRWTSRSYLHYVREGRTGDWRGLLQKLRSLKV